MAAPRVQNCHKDFIPQIDVEIPDPNTGEMGPPPTLGLLSGVTLRVSATQNGGAIHASLDALVPTERPLVPGRLYRLIEKTSMETYVLTLGVGAPFWVIWSKPGDFDFESTKWIVGEGTEL